MNSFYVWIAPLIENYEPTISQSLLKLGYVVSPADLVANKIISSRGCIAYYLSHPVKDSITVEKDVYTILNDNNMKYHFCLIAVNMTNLNVTWRGSNIEYNNMLKNKESKKLSSNIEFANPDDVVAHMNKILNSYSNSKSNNQIDKHNKIG